MNCAVRIFRVRLKSLPKIRAVTCVIKMEMRLFNPFAFNFVL